MKFKAIIFDLDGLVIDSEPLWAIADTRLLGKRGFTPTKELFIKRMGTSFKRSMDVYKEEFGIKESTESLVKERLKIFLGLLEKKIKPMEGLYQLLEQLSYSKIKLAIATSGHFKKIIKDKILKRLKIEKYFKVVITGESVKNLKPAPDIFLFAAKKLKIDPADCLVLEDAPNGIEAARRAGMKSFGVNKDEEIRERLLKTGADRVFSNLAEIKI